MLPHDLVLSWFLGCYYLTGGPYFTCYGLPPFLEAAKFANETNRNVVIHGIGEKYTLEKTHLGDVENIKSLKLKAITNKINQGVFHERLFRTSGSTHLELDGNELEELEAGLFTDLSLEYLEVNNCNVHKIQPGVFGDSPIKDIDILRNNVETIKKGVFTSQVTETILLNHNKISHIETGAFGEVKKLKVLSLLVNKLTNFEAGRIFGENAGLLVLVLSQNKLKELKKEDFAPLKGLKVLEIEGNQIQHIENNIFDGLKSLRLINLNYNNIIALQPNLFKHNTDLSYLFLGDNLLTYIPLEMISILPNLLELCYFNNPWQCKCLDNLNQTLTNRKTIADGCYYPIESFCTFDLPECVEDPVKSKELVRSYQRDHSLARCKAIYMGTYVAGLYE